MATSGRLAGVSISSSASASVHSVALGCLVHGESKDFTIELWPYLQEHVLARPLKG